MTDPAAAYVAVTDLHKSFFLEGKELKVLRGLQLAMGKGELTSLTGKSGAGKSTFLHLLGTLDSPSAGSIKIGGAEVTAMPNRQLSAFRNRTIGFVFQFHHLLPDFTALENVMLPALIARLPPVAARRRAEAYLERVGLNERRQHKPGELSGGEQQRVAVARALIMEPALLLADEPTGNLDQLTATAIHELLLELNRSLNLTMLIATHNLVFADSLPRRLVIEEGVLQE